MLALWNVYPVQCEAYSSGAKHIAPGCLEPILVHYL
jgi:hypothetical protein